MPTVDATPTALSTTATAGRTATGGVAATAATGLEGLFAEMMAAFTKTIGLPTDPTAAATSARPATATVAAVATPTDGETATDEAGADATARKAAETAAADLAGVMALVARGDTLRLADGGGLASPASLGARTATVSATSAATAGLDPTRAPADRAVAASATAAGTTTAATQTDATALVDAAVAGARTTAAATAPATAPRPTSTQTATTPTTDTGALAAAATVAAAATGGLAAATATLAAATEARLDAAATAQAAAIARSAAPAAATATAAAAPATEATAPATTAAAADDGLGLKSFVARRIAAERTGGDAPRSHFTAAAATDDTAGARPASAARSEPLASLAERPAADARPATPATDAAAAPRSAADPADGLATALHARRDADTTAPIAAVDAGKPSDDEPETARTDAASAGVPPTAARLTTPAETIAHRPTTTATADVAAVPLAAVAEHVAARAASGTSRFTVKLDPAELGSIDVRVEVRASGEVRAHLVVERADTLDMMLRDQKNLERSLGAAGLDVSSSGLQFSLRDQNRRDGGGDDRAPTRSAESDEIDEIAPRITQEAAIAAYRPLRAGGLDLRI